MTLLIKSIEIGQKAPPFELDGINLRGAPFNLGGDLGQKILLYFYPKDNTSGCSLQAQSFQAHLAEFEKRGISVVGISPDSLDSHKKFAEKYNLTFPLLSDGEKIVCARYGTWMEKSMYGRKYMGVDRSTFFIDEGGLLLQIWRKVKVPGHIQAILQYADTL